MTSAAAGVVPIFAPALARKICERAGLLDELGIDTASALDPEHYGKLAARRFGSRDAALFHYLMIGVERNWEPRSGFAPQQYWQENPDVFFSGYEPFSHYCRFGRYEGRSGGSSHKLVSGADFPTRIVEEILSRRRPDKRSASVDVIIPIYGNRALSLRAIDSVLSANTSIPFELVVVDDASPDGMLSRDLEALARAGLITLLVNKSNLGFVKSVNRGLALHKQRDVVLLNSDTLVFGDWLDRLLASLEAAEDIATATPLSNAATILSYPISLQDNAMPPAEAREIDAMCRSLDCSPIDIPTAVGFCMAIRRACLEQVGVFDAINFGRGYGEESDFCCRATLVGWRHVAAPTLFVWHQGGASFSAERESRVQQAQATLQRLHPTYHSRVREFILADLLRPLRSKLDAARAARDPRAKVLNLGQSRRETGPEELQIYLISDIGRFRGFRRAWAGPSLRLPNGQRLRNNSSQQEIASLFADFGIAKVRRSTEASVGLTLEHRLLEEARRQSLWIENSSAEGLD